MQPFASLLFQAAAGASIMLYAFSAYLSMRELIALFTVAYIGLRLYTLIRNMGYKAF